MTREQKVKSLQAIQEGRLLPDDIKPAQVFVFKQKQSGTAEGWTSNVGDFTEEQLNEFTKEREAMNHRREAVGLPADTLIRVIYESNFKNEQEAEN